MSWARTGTSTALPVGSRFGFRQRGELAADPRGRQQEGDQTSQGWQQVVPDYFSASAATSPAERVERWSLVMVAVPCCDCTTSLAQAIYPFRVRQVTPHPHSFLPVGRAAAPTCCPCLAFKGKCHPLERSGQSKVRNGQGQVASCPAIFVELCPVSYPPQPLPTKGRSKRTVFRGGHRERKTCFGPSDLH
ncbi:hypothetical protein VTK73DRAFT_8229 [Phialemonium thermophilum]|uniref:Uncharacterized protein n=1 Tax=Phialemonium thermophilum TaxID=223376 RepID=A0ABR3WA08_9PEZI